MKTCVWCDRPRLIAGSTSYFCRHHGWLVFDRTTLQWVKNPLIYPAIEQPNLSVNKDEPTS